MQENEQHKIKYLKLMHEIVPNQLIVIEALNNKLASEGSSISGLEPDDFCLEAIAAASLYLAASASAMESMFLMKVSTESEVSYCVTTNGTPSLARQAMECAALAEWTVSDLRIDILRAKGLAHLWDDAGKQDLYFADLQADVLVKQIGKRKVDLICRAEKIFLTKMNKHNEKIPMLALEDTSKICGNVNLSEELVTPEVRASVPGLGNGAWIFRKTSALVHGKKWATETYTEEELQMIGISSDSSTGADNGTYVTRTVPSYFVITMAMQLAFQLQNEAIKNLKLIQGLQ